MNQITKTYNVFSFEELNPETKEKVINKWYETEDFPFLTDDLMEFVGLYLEQNNIEFSNLELLYSLSYSQGDGLCFTGNFTYKGINYRISHNYRYYFASSVTIEKTDPETDEENSISFKNPDEFMQLYLKIAKSAEKHGYSILSYRMNNDEFSDLCEANGYSFLENGDMFNE